MIIRWILSHSVMLLVLIAILFAVWKVDDLHSWLPDVATRNIQHENGTTPDQYAEHKAVEHRTTEPGPASASKPVVESSASVDSKAAPVADSTSDSELQQRVDQGTGTDQDLTAKSHMQVERTSEPSAVKRESEKRESGQHTMAIASNEPDKSVEDSHADAVDDSVQKSPAASSKATSSAEAPASPADHRDVTSSSVAKSDGSHSGESLHQMDTSKTDAETIRQQWQSARQAYWRQDLDQAEALYLALRVKVPEDPDIVGELGNLYYARGDLQKAVDTYYEAGLLLRDAERMQEARILANEIHRLDARTANELRNQIDSGSAEF